MPSAAEKLASSLQVLQELQSNGNVAVRSRDLARTHRERLLKAGFLKPVIKGWYIPSRPDETAGESTAWYASFWAFCSTYLTERFGTQWCLSPEQSIHLQTGNLNVPDQLLVRSPKGTKNIIALPFNTSLMDIQADLPNAEDIEKKNGLNIYKLPSALIGATPTFYTASPNEARAALGTIRNASEILPKLLDGGHSTIAGRLVGAFRNIGKARIADDIIKAMRAAGHTVREQDPFTTPSPIPFSARAPSPHVSRLRLMWKTMRPDISDYFPVPSEKFNNVDAYLARIDATYVMDAYHSLSIEGYQVTPELIERVRSGNWNPDTNQQDQDQRNALAARGYWQAFQAVKISIEAVLRGASPGQIIEEQHGDWYRELFSPSIAAGLIKPSDLAGYRNGPVYIRQSMHIPPAQDAVLDLMETFFDLLTTETDPAARVALGHFGFVFIHPYMDGNGRMGRFLMNTLLTAGGYPWTVVPIDRRSDYMAALEQASVAQDIRPFAQFIGELVSEHQ